MKFIILFVFALYSSGLMAIELEYGVVSKGRDTKRTLKQKQASLIMVDVIKKYSQDKLKRSIGYVGLGNGEWYELNKDLEIDGVDVNKKTYLGRKKINRWPHLNVPAEIRFAPGMTQREKPTFYPNNLSAGCLTQSPLRYGDLEENGEKEIILILDDELIVFSPKYEQIVFAMFTDASDWWAFGNDSFLEAYINDHNGQKPAEEKLYHGYSHIWSDWAYRGQFEPGVRAYSKLFTGDFDDDGNPDVIKWEKVYRSNKKTASVAWNKVRSSLTHYERDLDAQKVTGAGVTGEYLPQITMDVIIEGWMRDRELTWQKGYPSKSECEGQEGQLIPEMHDPLLNDPDVLK